MVGWGRASVCCSLEFPTSNKLRSHEFLTLTYDSLFRTIATRCAAAVAAVRCFCGLAAAQSPALSNRELFAASSVLSAGARGDNLERWKRGLTSSSAPPSAWLRTPLEPCRCRKQTTPSARRATVPRERGAVAP